MIYLKFNPYDYNYSYSEWEKIIDEHIFNEENRAILKRKLLDGIVFDKLAEEFNLSYDQIRERFHTSMQKLIKHL